MESGRAYDVLESGQFNSAMTGNPPAAPTGGIQEPKDGLPISSLSTPVVAAISEAEMLSPPVGMASNTPASNRVRIAPIRTI